MSRSLLCAALLATSLWSPPVSVADPGCVGLVWPVAGRLLRPYAPVGAYAGHWGIDIGAEPHSVVRAAASGRVSFAGLVAGNLTVTVDHGGGLRTSYSFLDEQSVSPGRWLWSGAAIGRSGSPHGTPGLHFSVRLDGAYVNPLEWLGCHSYQPSRALRLVR